MATTRTPRRDAEVREGAIGPVDRSAARALDRISGREHFAGPDDLVYCSVTGEHLIDAPIRSAFYEALDAAELGDKRTTDDPIVFHDLRHTFGTLAVEAWPLHDVQAYMVNVHHTPKTAAADALTRILEAASGADGRDAGRGADAGRRICRLALGGAGIKHLNQHLAINTW